MTVTSAAEDLTIVMVAAVGQNRVIGADEEMPWHLPEDLAHFKETTMGHPVVLGRVTYETIAADLGGPLPGRTNVVLTSRDLDLPAGAVVADSIEAALSAAREALADDQETVYVVGGATVYEQFLPLADRLVLTEVEMAPEGDAYFPAFDEEEWAVVDRDERERFAFVTYERAE